MGGVAASRQDKALGHVGAANVQGDRVQLGARAVFVILALDHQDGASDPRNTGLDVPGQEARVQPDVVPAPEDLIDVAVIAGELAPQVRRPEQMLGPGDAFHRQGFDEHVRRFEDQAGHVLGVRTGVDERDRTAVAVPDEDRAPYSHLLQHPRQDRQRLTVHVIHVVPGGARIRHSMALARIGEDTQSGPQRELVGEVLPHGQGAQALVQKHDVRQRVVRFAGPAALQPNAVDRDGAPGAHATAEPGRGSIGSRSRSR